MATIFEVLLASRVESAGCVHMYIGIVFGHCRKSPVVIHMLVGLDEGSYFIIGEHLVDAFTLEAFFHPHIIPTTVKEVFGDVTIQIFNFN